ncbi:MAG TPA: hypothetical protein VI815_01910 [Candidatus Nanoarchaeia archaeon]|nr:hypothetical protein [Candidatus Nanoarchaeia archaeon]
MKIELLKDISQLVAGKNTSPIVDLLFDKKNVNEFLIAKKLGLTINQTRNMLYKLSDEGLVSFVRKKDKKKGWYTYFWTFNPDKALELLQKNVIKEIEQVEHQLKSREVKRFYICPSCNIEVSEETALVNNFTCSECGEVYELNDNKKSIGDLNSNINKLKKKLEEIKSELAIIGSNKTKKMVKDMKKEAKEKAEKRRKAVEERRKTRAKKMLKEKPVKVVKTAKKPKNKKPKTNRKNKKAKKR